MSALLATAVEDSRDPQATAEERRTVDQQKRAYFETHAISFGHLNMSNLRLVHKTFVQYADAEGILSQLAFAAALRSLEVTDADLIDRTFVLFDAHKVGYVEYKEVIAALDVILNGANQRVTAADCFHVLDPTDCGYIIQNVLLEHKRAQRETDGMNHLMIKVLLEHFTRLQQEEELRRVKAVPKRSRRLRARRGPGGPAALCPKLHISLDEFHELLRTDPVLVQAFTGQILATLESIYLRNKAAAAKLAMRQSAVLTASSMDLDAPDDSGQRGRGLRGRQDDSAIYTSRSMLHTSRSVLHTSRSGGTRSPRFREDTNYMVSARKGQMTSRVGSPSPRGLPTSRPRDSARDGSCSPQSQSEASARSRGEPLRTGRTAERLHQLVATARTLVPTP
eukprot:EG_transcript_11105